MLLEDRNDVLRAKGVIPRKRCLSDPISGASRAGWGIALVFWHRNQVGFPTGNENRRERALEHLRSRNTVQKYRADATEQGDPPMEIRNSLLEACHAHGIAHHPLEACGVLSGPRATPHLVDRFHPLPNVIDRLHREDPQRYPRTGKDAYVIDPQALMHLERALRTEERELRVYMHTHVDVGPYFSEEDIARATWAGEPLIPGAVYLVCGVRADRADGAILVRYDAQQQRFVSEEIAAREQAPA